MAQLSALDEEFTVLVNRAIRRTADRVAATMSDTIMSLAKDPTGQLADSVTVVHSGAWEYRVFPTATDNGFPYGKVFNTGRGEVKPIRARMLRYRDGSYHKYSSPYSGSHFVRETVSRFR